MRRHAIVTLALAISLAVPVIAPASSLSSSNEVDQKISELQSEIDVLQELKKSLNSGSDDNDTSDDSEWEIDNYIDDWGDDTEDQYLRTIVNGTFSNSATTGSDLQADVFFDKDHFWFRLLEYSGDTTPTIYSTGHILIMLKIGDSKYDTTLPIAEAGSNNDIYLKNYYKLFPILLNALKNEEPEIKIKIAILNDYASPQEFNFIISGTGFNKLYNKLYGSETGTETESEG